MSVQSREISHSLQKNIVYYTPSPPQKQDGAETFAMKKKILQLGTDIIEALAKPL
jgi:hypothetical protein